MRRFVSFAPAAIVLVTVVTLVAAVPTLIGRASYASTQARIALARQTLDEDDLLERIDRAVSAVAEAVSPSVVHVTAGGRGSMQRGGPGGSGAGWVFDEDGHIVTNAHVVREAARIRVQFSDGRFSEARIVGIDPFTDIAVIRVEETLGLFPAERATNVIPKQGQTVFAFGSPFGFKFSMSRGIISGLGREPRSAVGYGGYTNFIQTDAAVNPGNSGGPLIDVKGRVIGMNVAIATGAETEGTTRGQSAGISFAIPLATIESVATQLIERGEVSRGFLGISLPREPVPVESASFLGAGVPVPNVVAGGPADAAGLETGDVILTVGGRRTPSVEKLRSLVSNVSPGEVIELQVWRDGQMRSIEVTAGEFTFEQLAEQSVGGALRGWFGVQLSESGDAAVVESTGMRGGLSGLRPGMRITHVDEQRVRDLTDVYTRLAHEGFLSGQPVEIRVRAQGGESEAIELQLPR